MLVEINLLPQKEKKNKSLLLLAIISVSVLLIGVFLSYWFGRSYDEKITNLDQSISTAEQLATLEQEKKTSDQTTNSLAQLESTVNWAKDYPIKTVPILKELTALLPERGFIQTFKYEEAGKITLGVQFEENRDAAYYLNTLLDSSWFSDAKINNINAITNFYDKKIGETVDETKMKNEKYVPRYLSEFEITLNGDVIKAELAEKNSESDTSKEKGGDGS